MKKFILFIFLLGFVQLKSQSLRVYFKDKAYIKSSISVEDVALSPKAIQNRYMRNIGFNEDDLPISESYLNSLREVGAEIIGKSRWFNCALITGVSEDQLLQFDFIAKVEFAEKYNVDFAEISNQKSNKSTSSFNYGLARQQIEMVRGEILHDFNFQGQGMTIAVIDGGFSGVDTGKAFDSLWMNNRILGTKSFVNSHPTIYEDGSHGTRVLSVLGAHLEGQIIGSAPKANYWLLKSEKESSEKPVEMDNWLMAAEFADSVGADIISSSLGYNEFQGGTGNHVYADMDGNTTIVTKAADKAASKGILVIVSAGNEGNGAWRHITAPADGDSVLAIGSVTNLQNISSFSSRGPSSDGRIKPNVVAMGQATANSNGNTVNLGNGTSFSCPIVSGMAACLWQSNVLKTNMDIFYAIQNSATIAGFPNNDYGHGVPNFELALYNTIGLDEGHEKMQLSFFPNPVLDELRIKCSINPTELVAITLFDAQGNLILELERTFIGSEIIVDFPFSPGVFFLRMNVDGKMYTQKIIK